ncbi:4-hydroxybenzoate polyprenyltransferase [Lentzea flaviverrucosa]|uniref:4-hydroxybenzoate polyprenyltransferase n=1 Tax=Lentzea flaviverrucosa TaxID=200379 RepID=A0A1H9BK02_9PSEU|nr:4-hydroxybenzoate polyprenyltransferase [Lentzea flaviverrucosa]SEP89324.1 4-hydroxybenzoate polyprenyltransferase [Lentzea flaviverrucosa]
MIKAYVDLVRAPAALTVLGDTLVGAGKPLRGKGLLLPLASVSLYWAGMALNDWADRDLDAAERPERPIPSGRISPDAALAAAAGLTALGVGLAAAAGRNALPLAAAVWAYDTVLKATPAGPFAMAACRAFDVLLGGRAVLPAGLMAAHTLGVTVLSRGEVHGTTPGTAKAVLTGTVLTAVAAGASTRRFTGIAAALGYAVTVGRAQWQVVRQPSAESVRAATKEGVHGMVLLQSALAEHGAALPLVLPLAQALSRKVSPT